MSNEIDNRTVIRLGGEAAAEFLNGVAANDISKATPGGAVFTALLTPQGKIQFEFFVFGVGNELFLDVAAQSANALLTKLKMYRLRAKVSIDPAPDLAVATARTSIAGNAIATASDPRHPALGFRAIVSGDHGTIDSGYNARRIALGVPEFGRDFDADEVFLMDVNYDLLNGVSYAKGCFVGQEVTSRMKRKSAARKRTVIIESTNELTPGSDVIANDTRLGAVTSCEGDRGLARVRIDRLEGADGKVTVGAAEATLRLPEYLQECSKANS